MLIEIENASDNDKESVLFGLKRELLWLAECRKNNNPGGNIQSISSKDINALHFLCSYATHQSSETNERSSERSE